MILEASFRLLMHSSTPNIKGNPPWGPFENHLVVLKMKMISVDIIHIFISKDVIDIKKGEILLG